MILAQHVPIYAEIFALSDFLADPLLCFGNHETVLTDEITEKIGSNLDDRIDEIVHREMRNMLKNVTQKKYFEVRVPRQFIEPEGIKIDQPVVWGDTLLWCVARKVKQIDGFVIPQQKACKAMYS